ncbi:hypothetical protein BV22DRAFT_288894 [Leucogyrophana mollusca]|uniref:Uncharacterized protein n=1 Tax=Leucogyrophana mollusca TaxID=85980 RepID=A0ACB8BQB7_9AGAM|nr:hypothetical protein BV22DRAFT_288894 [Leucogyrophana mollusca]
MWDSPTDEAVRQHTLTQVWIYFRTSARRDGPWVRLTIAAVWIIQALQIAISSHMASISLPTYNSDVQVAAEISVEWAIYVGTTSITAFLVHVLFIRRLHLLGKYLLVRWNTAPLIALITLAAQVLALFSMVQILRLNQADPGELVLIMGRTIPVWLGMVVLGDILIATSLCALLYRSRTGSPRADRLLKRLIVFCVQTGLITSLVALATIGIWIAAGFDTRHLFISFPMGGLYAICLNANYLARSSYLNDTAPIPVEDIEVGDITARTDKEALGAIEFAPSPFCAAHMSSSDVDCMAPRETTRACQSLDPAPNLSQDPREHNPAGAR